MLRHAAFTFHGLSEIKLPEPRPFLWHLLSMSLIQGSGQPAPMRPDPGSERRNPGKHDCRIAHQIERGRRNDYHT